MIVYRGYYLLIIINYCYRKSYFSIDVEKKSNKKCKKNEQKVFLLDKKHYFCVRKWDKVVRIPLKIIK